MIPTTMTLPKGTVASTLFLLLPLVLWFVYQPPTLTAATLGKILGVVGFSAFTYSLLLSVRVPFQEKIFGDLGNSYRVHQTVGTLALMMLSLHPILLAWQYFTFSPRSAAVFLLPMGDLEKTLGAIALYVMALCIICTYYVKLPYHTWKTVHKFLSIAFILGALHSITIFGDIQFMPALKALFFLFFVAGVGAILYRVLFNKIFVRRAQYVVASVHVINDTFVDVTLTPKEKPITVMPGQFAYVTYSSDTVKSEEHPFSVASAKPDGTLRFISKKLGDFTNTLPNLKVGDSAMIEGPFGSFTFAQGGTTQCWIAGGIGITPFLAFAEALPATHNATLVYAIRNDQENAVASDLERLKKSKPNLNVVVWNSEKQGYLTAKDALTGFDPANVDIFLCGPGGMVTAMREQLFALGIPHHHIHQEKFSMLPS